MTSSTTTTAAAPAPGAADAHQSWVLDAVARHEGHLILYAARLLGDRERARDVAQDTFLKLCGQSREAIGDRLAEWLFTVCRNRALDILRKEGRMTRLGDELVQTRAGDAPDPAVVAEQSEAEARLLEHLDRLPENQREVIRLKFQNGFSYREISRISGHSVSNVGFLIHTGLKTLRRRLADGLPA